MSHKRVDCDKTRSKPRVRPPSLKKSLGPTNGKVQPTACRADTLTCEGRRAPQPPLLLKHVSRRWWSQLFDIVPHRNKLAVPDITAGLTCARSRYDNKTYLKSRTPDAFPFFHPFLKRMDSMEGKQARYWGKRLATYLARCLSGVNVCLAKKAHPRGSIRASNTPLHSL
jgi:hypothetical protein